MKLPRGIKRMRLPASDETLDQALEITSETTFNGYIRTTAPKGVKEAGVVLYQEGKPRLAVFQSPDRSLYGPDALVEVKRIASAGSGFIRVEEFLAQNLDEVQVIVKKMRKARIQAIDVEKALQGVDVEAEVPDEVPIPGLEAEEEGGEVDVAEPETEDLPDGEHAPVPDEQKEGGLRAKVTDRIVKSKAASPKEEDDFLKMMKEVGMSPPGDEAEPMDDEVNQYIAAFEDFLTRKEDDEDLGRGGVVTTEMATAVDDIMDDMLEAAADDPALMEFIESQRERIIAKVAISDVGDTPAERHDRLTEQQTALEHISSTFREVLAVSETEAERRRSRLAELKEAGEAGEDELEVEERRLEEDAERTSSLGEVLDRVLTTHIERLEAAEDELEDEASESMAAAEAEAEVAAQELDLESAKRSFIEEMRTRIQTVSAENGDEPAPGGVTEAVRSVSDGIQERVEELEHERDVLTMEQTMLEEQTDDLAKRREAVEVDMGIEVEARLKDLEAQEKAFRERTAELEELEQRLQTEREKVEKDLEHARSERERVTELEVKLEEREQIIKEQEEELKGKHEEVDGLKDHLEQEIAQRVTELEELEARLNAQEEELVTKEAEIERTMEAVEAERKGDEADLERVEQMEEELRKREEEYNSKIAGMETVMEALREELRENIERSEGLEKELEALRETETKVAELEERLAVADEMGGASDATDLEKEDLRKLLAYLDDLLSKLPEQEIEKFSKTEYFELYGRVLDKLGI